MSKIYILTKRSSLNLYLMSSFKSYSHMALLINDCLPSQFLFISTANKNLQLLRASLVAQCLRIRLPMQGTWVQALVQEDPTCRGATKPASHNYRAREPRACAPEQEKPALQQRVALTGCN